MNPYRGIFVKISEISIFYPLHSIIYYQHVNCTTISKTIQNLNKYRGFYNGIHFQLMYLPINKFIDLQCYRDYDKSIYGRLMCSSIKVLTYPIHSFEVYYNLYSRYPKIKNLYNGNSFYFISNTLSYVIWFNSLEYFNKKIKICEDKVIKSNKDIIIHNFCVGFISGLIVDVLMNPLRVIKTNLQNDYKNTIKNLLKLETYIIFNKKNLLIRGLKSRLILSGLQSSYFNLLINTK